MPLPLPSPAGGAGGGGARVQAAAGGADCTLAAVRRGVNAYTEWGGRWTALMQSVAGNDVGRFDALMAYEHTDLDAVSKGGCTRQLAVVLSHTQPTESGTVVPRYLNLVRPLQQVRYCVSGTQPTEIATTGAQTSVARTTTSYRTRWSAISSHRSRNRASHSSCRLIAGTLA
eukprot:SAG11_NODE_2641_length_3139_cov_12.838487_1_plen_172_part_00